MTLVDKLNILTAFMLAFVLFMMAWLGLVVVGSAVTSVNFYHELLVKKFGKPRVAMIKVLLAIAYIVYEGAVIVSILPVMGAWSNSLDDTAQIFAGFATLAGMITAIVVGLTLQKTWLNKKFTRLVIMTVGARLTRSG